MTPAPPKPRILLAPMEVAGYYADLCRGFRDLRVSCDFASFQPHPFGYGGETLQSPLLRLIQKLSSWQSPPRPLPLRALAFALSEPLKFLWMLGAVFRYDVFVFAFGQSLLAGNLDLPLLKALGKTVICNVAHGSEARAPYMDGTHQVPEGQTEVPLSAIVRGTRRRRARLQRIARWATLTIGAPYSSTQLGSGRMINWFALGIPFRPRESAATNTPSSVPKTTDTSVTILHAPSHPVLKGSAEIRAAIESLRTRGHSVNFVEIQGKPFAEVQQALRDCDFVVDQLYSDTPMATLATEAAWFGKPSVIGGYGLQDLAALIPTSMRPVARHCAPEDAEAAIEALLSDPDERQRLGSAAQRFVQECWGATRVAERYLRLIANDIPDEWWIEAGSVNYFHGCGQQEQRTRRLMREMIEHHGLASLQLGAHATLEQAAQAFAREESAGEQSARTESAN